MASLDQRLPALSLVQIVSCLPVTSQPKMKSTSKVFQSMMESELFILTRRSIPTEVVVVKPRAGKNFVRSAGELLDAFLKPDGFAKVESIRVECEKDPFYQFVQLRQGGQVEPEPFEDVYINGLDPKGPKGTNSASLLRKAWWASVRSVLDGLPIPHAARILLVGERRSGGRSSYCVSMALVWTGKDFGFVKCRLDAAYLDCSMTCGGGVMEKDVTSGLALLRKKLLKMKSFDQFMSEFESALNKMTKKQKWEEDWDYPPMDEGDDEEDIDAYHEDPKTIESYFRTDEKPDLGPWCFGK